MSVHGVNADIDLNLIVTEDKEIYVRFSGFNTMEDANSYADFLEEYLALLLFESEVMH